MAKNSMTILVSFYSKNCYLLLESVQISLSYTLHIVQSILLAVVTLFVFLEDVNILHFTQYICLIIY